LLVIINESQELDTAKEFMTSLEAWKGMDLHGTGPAVLWQIAHLLPVLKT
jgi:hypothetical protein